MVSVSASAATYRYQCDPIRGGDAFLDSGYTEVTVSQTQLRFKQYDKASGRAELLRDYTYSNEGPAGGRGAVKDMLRFKLTHVSKSYGDSLPMLFIDDSLPDGGDKLRSGGKGGMLTFPGQGYKYDWNLCSRDVPRKGQRPKRRE